MIRFLVITLLLPTSAWAIDGTISSALDKLTQAALIDAEPVHSMLPKDFPKDLQSKELDIEKLTGLDVGSGREYGSIGYQRLPYSSTDILHFLHQDNVALNLISNVETLRDIHVISEKHSDQEAELLVKLAINVPVVSDFHVQMKIRTYEDEKKHGVYEWQSLNDEGDLNYARGAVIVKPHDDKSSDVYVVGAYVIKPEGKVPWIGRGTARNFAKAHYSSYITALESGLKNRK